MGKAVIVRHQRGLVEIVRKYRYRITTAGITPRPTMLGRRGTEATRQCEQFGKTLSTCGSDFFLAGARPRAVRWVVRFDPQQGPSSPQAEPNALRREIFPADNISPDNRKKTHFLPPVIETFCYPDFRAREAGDGAEGAHQARPARRSAMRPSKGGSVLAAACRAKPRPFVRNRQGKKSKNI